MKNFNQKQKTNWISKRISKKIIFKYILNKKASIKFFALSLQSSSASLLERHNLSQSDKILLWRISFTIQQFIWYCSFKQKKEKRQKKRGWHSKVQRSWKFKHWGEDDRSVYKSVPKSLVHQYFDTTFRKWVKLCNFSSFKN